MEIARHWRLQRQRYALVVRCAPAVARRVFPVRYVCPHLQAPPLKTPFTFSARARSYLVLDPCTTRRRGPSTSRRMWSPWSASSRAAVAATADRRGRRDDRDRDAQLRW